MGLQVKLVGLDQEEFNGMTGVVDRVVGDRIVVNIEGKLKRMPAQNVRPVEEVRYRLDLALVYSCKGLLS